MKIKTLQFTGIVAAIFASALIALLALPRLAAAEAPGCSAPGGNPNETPLASRTATAGLWDNLRQNPGSIRVETRLLLEEAVAARSKHPPGSSIAFSSVPAKFKTDYGEKADCEAMLEKTTKEPIVYADRQFADLEQLSEWFAELSQGKGDDGKDLYRRCPGSCSPQYRSVISVPEAGSGAPYRITASIVCGHARDKDDNKYQLGAALRWGCQNS